MKIALPSNQNQVDEHFGHCEYFKPRGIPSVDLQEVVLSLDEFEAIRLADHEQVYQEEAATRMNISRQTFGRIIGAAHKKDC